MICSGWVIYWRYSTDSLANALLLAGKMQRIATASAGITSAAAYQSMALGSEGDLFGTAAAIQVVRAPPLGHGIIVAAVRRQAEHAGHQSLPFPTMGADTVTIQCLGKQVRHFVGYGLLQKMLMIFPVQLFVEAQQITLQIGDSRLLTTQIQTDLGPFKRPGEVLFGEQVALFQSIQ